MHYYQAPDQSLHALDDPAFVHLLPAGSVEITAAQYATLSAPPAPTAAQIEAQYNFAIQGVLDAYAQSMRYDNMNTMVTYVYSTNAQFKAEATAAVAWRDSVWASAYATLAAVQAGTQPMPASVQAFIATLPVHP